MDSLPSASTAISSIYIEDPIPSKRILGFVEPTLLSRILRISLPVIIGMLTQSAINAVDSALVGHLPEQYAVAGTAALGPAMVLLWAFGGFLSSISVGTQALAARRIGEGDPKGAGKVLTNTATIAFISSTIVTLLSIALCGPIFRAISPDPMVQQVGIEYCQVRFLGIFAMVMMASYKSFYDALGQVRVHMTIAIFMNIINAITAYVLIFGKWGFPQLYVTGAAWGAVVSSLSGFLMILAWSLRKKDRDLFAVYTPRNLDAKVAKSAATLSIWSGLATTFVMTGFALFYFIVGQIDKMEQQAGVNTSATSVIITIMMTVFMISIAFGSATSTLVSQSIGAKKYDLATRYGWQSVLLIMLIMGALGACIVAFPDVLLRIFLPADAAQNEALKDAVIRVATPSLQLCGAVSPIIAAALVLAQALYGAGESRFVMVVELILHALCLVPLAYVLAVVMNMGLVGCWIAAGIYGAALLTAAAYKFASGSWKKLHL